ncbi:hypothetical protein [Marinobacterium rhizophilum]|uniref:Tetratricopeptide repeat protein n=1 Tax=Marinobacterium rhizophilum TaxID=420402 RepID=A0ABY5HE36_9GAMM|nr:hypothetical protein [Marinobacterium rhizophilum]UTW10618.1 hypothetical protein KDW95_15120 [Marinobacterium rhizophilum]
MSTADMPQESEGKARTRRRRRSGTGRQSRLAPLGWGLLLCCALALLVTGGRLVIAGIASYQAESFIEHWNEAGTAPAPRAWAVAQAAAERAVRFYPGTDGDHYDRLGRIHEWQHAFAYFGDPAARASREAARDAYRVAVQARPDWPYTWVQLAYVKLRLQEFDAEFDTALARGFELGPWRIDANRWLAEIGLLAWPQLNSAQQAQTLESIRRTVAYSNAEARRLLTLAQGTGQQQLLCDALPFPLKTRRKICL